MRKPSAVARTRHCRCTVGKTGERLKPPALAREQAQQRLAASARMGWSEWMAGAELAPHRTGTEWRRGAKPLQLHPPRFLPHTASACSLSLFRRRRFAATRPSSRTWPGVVWRSHPCWARCVAYMWCPGGGVKVGASLLFLCLLLCPAVSHCVYASPVCVCVLCVVAVPPTLSGIEHQATSFRGESLVKVPEETGLVSGVLRVKLVGLPHPVYVSDANKLPVSVRGLHIVVATHTNTRTTALFGFISLPPSVGHTTLPRTGRHNRGTRWCIIRRVCRVV